MGPIGCNCSIVVCEETREALVIDPGGDIPLIEKTLKKHQAQVKWLLHTHAHIDHVGGTQDLKDAHACACAFHPGEKWLIEHLTEQAQFLPIPYRDIETIDHWCRDADAFKIGSTIRVDVCHTPGHTPGSQCFLISEKEKPQVMCTGDTLFRGSIGRTDLWGGDSALILKSIHQKLLMWPEDIPVITGHGPKTTLALEKDTNPFLQS